jgi:hypothetical protein
MRAAGAFLASKMHCLTLKGQREKAAQMERTIDMDVHQSDWVNLLGTLWCRQFHDSVMWPIHGEYECRSCGGVL